MLDLFQPGYLVAGRYRIESALGAGGHAYVYKAVQQGLDRVVAIKVLKSAPGLNDGSIDPHKAEVLTRRFEQEAKLISQLKDPGTITMYDYGATEDGLLYLVMEYIEGISLKDLMEQEGALHHKRVVKILEQLLYSLQEAHAIGILHRDLKPENIVMFTHLGRRDRVKLLDFGIAKIVGVEDKEDLTAEGSLVGTPRYIAPERIRGVELSPSSDLYSLGLVMYELLTGLQVYDGVQGVAALRAQLTDGSIQLPETLHIPGNLRAIINRMMQKEHGARYKIAQQILDDLEHWDNEPPQRTTQDGVISQTFNRRQTLPNSPRPDTLPTGQKAVKPGGNNTLFYVLTGAVILAMLSIVALLGYLISLRL